MRLESLGDQGVLAHFPAEPEALAFAAAVRAADWPEVIDIVPAYFSVAGYHDPARVSVTELQQRLAALSLNPSSAAAVGRLHVIPCCYDLGPDLARVAEQTRLNPSQVIESHAGSDY